MKKFNYIDWVTKNKQSKTLKENFTPDLEDDERKRKLIQQMIAKEKEARKKEITGMEDVNEEPSEGNAFGLAMQKAKEAGEDSFELDGETFKVSEMKVTNKDGKDVTSDVIKALEKSLKKSGYTIGKTYTSDPELYGDDPNVVGHSEKPKKEVDDGKEGQQEPSEDEKDPRNDPNYDMDQHYMDYDLPEEKLKSLAEALGYITIKND